MFFLLMTHFTYNHEYTHRRRICLVGAGAHAFRILEPEQRRTAPDWIKGSSSIV
jgi:hypothetical protein